MYQPKGGWVPLPAPYSEIARDLARVFRETLEAHFRNEDDEVQENRDLTRTETDRFKERLTREIRIKLGLTVEVKSVDLRSQETPQSPPAWMEISFLNDTRDIVTMKIYQDTV